MGIVNKLQIKKIVKKLKKNEYTFIQAFKELGDLLNKVGKAYQEGIEILKQEERIKKQQEINRQLYDDQQLIYLNQVRSRSPIYIRQYHRNRRDKR